MTRPATLPELLAQGIVKPGDWVECVTGDDNRFFYEPGQKFHVSSLGLIRENRSDGSLGTFRPLKPAKAKKWSGWVKVPDGGEGAFIAAFCGGHVCKIKKTADGLMIKTKRAK